VAGSNNNNLLCTKLSPTKTILQMTPYELWHGAKLNIKLFCIFGFDVHIHIFEKLGRKLDSKSHKCIFINYSDEVKGYKFYDPQNMKLLTSCDVIFDECFLLQVSRTIQGGEIQKLIEPSQTKSIQVHQQIQRKKN
jgi:hypothetical protein